MRYHVLPYILASLAVSVVGIFVSNPALASEKAWTQTNESGFGDSQNTSATLFKIFGQLYAVTDNVHGVQAYHYDSTDSSWEEVTSLGFLDDNDNVAVSAKIKIRGNAVFLAFTNDVTGAQVWQLEDIGSQGHILGATQVNYDGFGNSGYTSVLHLLKFNNRILAYVQNSGDGNVRVLRTPIDSSQTYEYMSWQFLTDLGLWAEGLDAAAIFEDVIYIANGDPAAMYTSTDGQNYTFSTVYDEYSASHNVSQIAQLKVAKRNERLFAAGTARRFCYEARQELSFLDDGIDWVPDDSRPSKSFCYTHIVPKQQTDVMYVLGFDSQDGVIYQRNRYRWTQQTAQGLVGNDSDGIDSTSNRQFSDGIWYHNSIVLATVNQVDGTQIWRKK